MDNIKITKRTVGNLKCSPGKDRTLFWDTEIRGFGVAAFKSGAKVYVVQYRKDGRSHRFALGKHGPLTAEQARSKARETLGKVIGGADPITERKEARAVRTFKEVAEDFLGHVARLKKPRTAEEYRRLLKNHVYPEPSARRASSTCRRADVVATDCTRKWAGTPVNANRALAVISSVWGWAAKPAQGSEVSAAANPVPRRGGPLSRARARALS